MSEHQKTELEQVYERVINKLKNQVSDLTVNLHLAHTQIEMLQEEKEQQKEQGSKEENAEK